MAKLMEMYTFKCAHFFVYQLYPSKDKKENFPNKMLDI